MGFAEPELGELRRKRNGRIKAVRTFLNMVLNGDRLFGTTCRRELRAGESGHISHACLGEVK
jgi:hypothetical protein